MGRLEVEAAVEEVKVGGAGDVHGRSELAVGVRFEKLGVGDHVGGDGDGLREVGKNDLQKEEGQSSAQGTASALRTDLNVKWAGDSEADEKVEDSVSRAVDVAEYSAKPRPEESDAADLHEAKLEELRIAGGEALEHEGVGEDEEVGASEAHDDVVELVSVQVSRSARNLEQLVREAHW